MNGDPKDPRDTKTAKVLAKFDAGDKHYPADQRAVMTQAASLCDLNSTAILGVALLYSIEERPDLTTEEKSDMIKELRTMMLRIAEADTLAKN